MGMPTSWRGAAPPWLAVRVLLERSEELRALSAALDEACSGAVTTVWVGGEAGSGKSTLTAHFTATAPCRVLRSGCDGATTAAPLGPLIDIAPALAVDVPGDAGEPVDRIRLFAATRAALVAEPTVWLVEDLHWADAPTLDLIRYLARRRRRGPCPAAAHLPGRRGRRRPSRAGAAGRARHRPRRPPGRLSRR